MVCSSLDRPVALLMMRLTRHPPTGSEQETTAVLVLFRTLLHLCGSYSSRV
jgi:hypothetical protein